MIRAEIPHRIRIKKAVTGFWEPRKGYSESSSSSSQEGVNQCAFSCLQDNCVREITVLLLSLFGDSLRRCICRLD